ncbi:hypothetical protein KC349_g2228 [Hortaea werneckii]|nr:hypothetical protein KC349_g2228 [Hortaea werneckii]
MDHSSAPQDDLNAMWMDFVKDFDKIGGTQYPNSSQVITSVQDVEARLAKLQLQKGDSGAKVKEGILRSLQCAQSLGQIASKGATIAFGPAEACFGAANLVIDGLRDALKVFDNLPELFSRMSGFLVIFEEKLRGSGHYRESRALVNDQFLERLQDALGLASSNDVADNMRLHRDIGLQLVPDTGKWMLESDGFQQWADPDDDPSHAIFAISDVKQTGKTFLSHRIVQHLQAASQLTSAPPTVAAYFYFPSQSSDTCPTMDNTSLSLAMRNIALQIALADRDFALRLSTESGRNVDLFAPASLWRILFDHSRDSKTTYFIILDSLFPTTPDPNQLFIDIARDLSTWTTRSQPARLRLLLSGRPAFFESLETLPPEYQFPHPRYAHIKERRNEKDLALFIDYRLAQSNLPETTLQQIKDVAVQDFPAFELYPRLTGLLDAICKEHRVNKITMLLKRAQSAAHQEPIDAVEARIAVVDNGLQSNINELNAILAWFIVLGTDEELPLRLLNQAVMLHNEHIGDESLGMLEHRIRTAHHHLLGIKKRPDGAYVRIRDNLDMEGYIDRQERVAREGKAVSKGHGGQPTMSASSCLPREEVENVRKGLKAILSADRYEKFGFEEFFDSKLGPVVNDRGLKVHVRLGRNQALVRVVRTCLDAICYHTIDDTFHLVHDFAVHSLTGHLHSIDLEKMGKEPKKGLGLKSLQLFHDRKVMSG